MAIVLDQVTKVLGGNTVIDHVSCEIPAGQITGLKGINGSGKTMLMRLIAGLIYPTSGQIIVDGKVLGKDISFPPSLGVMLENPSFLNTYSGADNLKLLMGMNHKVDDQEICDVLMRVGLGDGGRKKYRSFSLGMKQRLGIAAAILEKPDILLLDEPTNALDADGVELIKKIIREEKERGATIIISCHDAEILTDLADQIICIASGKIVGLEKAQERNM